jgi:hypothetical protein
VTDFERYEMAGSLLLCRDCGAGGTRHIVKNFGQRTVGMAEADTEMFIHESDHHEPVFADNMSEVARAAKRVSLMLAAHAEAVAFDVRNGDYYRCYDPAFAYRDGMVNGMGGATGDMAALFGPEVVKVISRALKDIAAMDKDYSELIQDHNRKTCDDFTCFIFGHLVEIARLIDSQLP